MSCVREAKTLQTLNDLASQISTWIDENGKEAFHLQKLKPILEKYQGYDWSFCSATHSKDYCRHVWEASGDKDKYPHYGTVFEIIILTWNPKGGTPVHDHPNSGCIYKVLQGELIEELYDSSQSNKQCQKINQLQKGDTGYIDDNVGLHRIWNPSDETSVSVHIYEAGYKPNCFDCFDVPDCC